jgi:SmpA / OmlA family
MRGLGRLNGLGGASSCLQGSGLFKKVVVLGLLASLLGLAGCDPQRISELEEGVSSEADVRARFGEPERVWDGANGVRIFEYNRQPAGHKNYMISIGTDGKMASLRQVLTPENFAKVQPGMMMEDVRKMLGKPMKVMPYELKQETYYNYRYLVDHNNTSMVFSAVMNADMRVLRTETMLDPEVAGNPTSVR